MDSSCLIYSQTLGRIVFQNKVVFAKTTQQYFLNLKISYRRSRELYLLIESFREIAESLKNLLRFLFLWKLLSQEFGSLLKMKIVTDISQISETQFLENSFLKKNYGMYFVGCLESYFQSKLSVYYGKYFN